MYIASYINMMHNDPMRTTITLNDETHDFASYYARARGLTLSAAIDELIRKAEAASAPPVPEIEYSEIGLPIFPPTGRTITSEMVKKLEEEEYDPAKFA
jgi:hypothetical protein